MDIAKIGRHSVSVIACCLHADETYKYHTLSIVWHRTSHKPLPDDDPMHWHKHTGLSMLTFYLSNSCSIYWYQMRKDEKTKMDILIKVIEENAFESAVCKMAAILLRHQCVTTFLILNRQTAWASYQMRKIASCACTRNAGNVFDATNFKRTAS